MLLVFNWKLNPQNFNQAVKLFEAMKTGSKKAKNSVIVICPPFEHLFRILNLGAKVSNLYFGAQDCFWENSGSYTGEISPLGLKTAGVDYVILGHSERRQYLDETNEMINKKLISALSFGLKPMLCLGEDEKTHFQGEKAVNSFLKSQLVQSLLGAERLSLSQKSNLILVYEPIWAISDNSGNLADNPADAAAAIKYLKEILVADYQLPIPKVLYGGSVNSKNIADFLKYPEVDGFLIGRASLNQQQAKEIMAIAG
ncbi:MAG: triose-phosphate isomerase [Patescibacteria group bacterium]